MLASCFPGGGALLYCKTYQVDDAGRGLLVTNEEKTLAGLGSPSNVALGNVSRLLGALVAGESLGLERVSAEEEELLAGDQVPREQSMVSKVAKD
jgi:hypothetical protein